MAKKPPVPMQPLSTLGALASPQGMKKPRKDTSKNLGKYLHTPKER